MARELLEWEQVLGPAGVVLVEQAAPAEPEPLPSRSPSARPRGEVQPAQGAPRLAEAVADPRPGPAPAPGPQGPPEERAGRLVTLSEQVAGCTACSLHQGRHRSVFARGKPDAELVFVGEGPGYHEDQQGLPFVGRAGELLDKMVSAMGYAQDDVYICNVVKCRPPENRTPLPDEAGACKPFLVEQIQLVAPRAIVALGRCAAEHLGCLEEGARGWRGRWSAWEGIAVMATYHPAFLLRSPHMKRPVWEDLQKVMARLGRAP